MITRWFYRLFRLSSIRSVANSEDGFLLPAVIIIALAISTVSVVALQTVATNSAVLTNQNYDSVARAAAKAGIAAALLCIDNNGGAVPWTSAPLRPGTDCQGAGTATTIIDSDIYATTYEVPVVDTSDQYIAGALLEGVTLTATGTVSIKGPGGTSIVRQVTQTTRTTITATTTSGGRESKPLSSLSTGPSTACAVTRDEGKAYCWGSNSNGQLGVGRNLVSGNISTNKSPMPVSTASTSAGAISGTCTGSIIGGNCLFGSWNPEPTPAQPASALFGKFVTQISVGKDHACAIAKDSASANDTTRKAYCWGRNNYGQLGNRTTTNSLTPIAVATDTGSALQNKTVVDISAGNGFTCALDSDGNVSCWGLNGDGQLGNNSRTNSNVAVAVSKSSGSALASRSVAKLAIVKGSATTMCAITTADAGVCWGKSDVGQTGSGNTIDATNRSGYDKERHTNPNQCNSLRTKVFNNAWNEAGGSPHADTDALVPVAVAGGLSFETIIINDAGTSGDAIESISAGTGTNRTSSQGSSYAYVTAKTTNNRAYYWGGSRSFDSWVDCQRNGSTYGSDWSEAESRVQRSYSGRTTPGILYNASSGNLQNVPMSLISGNAFNGLFCGVTGNTTYCDAHGTGSNEGQTGSGYVPNCTAFGCPTPPSGPQRVVYDTSLSPGLDAGAKTVLDIGDGYSCMVAGSAAYCWGVNGDGQLGRATSSGTYTASGYSRVPIAVDTSGDLGQVSTTTRLNTNTAVSF